MRRLLLRAGAPTPLKGDRSAAAHLQEQHRRALAKAGTKRIERRTLAARFA
jgi:hypothetical protein